MSSDPIIARWRANTNAAGVRLNDDDIERITARGLIERVQAAEAILARVDARETVPDYLGVLAAQPAGGGADG